MSTCVPQLASTEIAVSQCGTLQILPSVPNTDNQSVTAVSVGL